MASPTTDLTCLQHAQNWLARLVTKSPPFTSSVPLLRSLHWLPIRFRILFKINLLTYKTLREKQPVYLHSMLATSLHPIHRDQTTITVCQSLGSRPTQVHKLFTLVPRLFGTTFRCLSFQPIQLLPSRNIWRYISLTWPFPHRYQHARWPVDVMELFPQLGCWTLIRLLCHWAWLHRGYWWYSRLIDWLKSYQMSIQRKNHTI